MFSAVSARSASDAWVVGSRDLDSGLQAAYVQHWDGAHWRTVVADPGLYTSQANAVDARTAGDAWLVGDALASGAGVLVTFAEHWNGKRWTSVPTAKVDPSCDATLSGVAAVAAKSAWAVGSITCADGESALVEHWNGRRWSRVHVPAPRRSTMTGLEAVTAIAGNDIWAVGTWARGAGPGRTLALHFDGGPWSVVRSPNPGPRSCTHGLSGVSGASSDDVWAASTRSCSRGVTAEMLHWDGTAWTSVPVPRSGFDNPPGDGFFDIAAFGRRSAVTVGIAKTRGPSVERGFIEHWNGSRWSLD